MAHPRRDSQPSPPQTTIRLTAPTPHSQGAVAPPPSSSPGQQTSSPEPNASRRSISDSIGSNSPRLSSHWADSPLGDGPAAALSPDAHDRVFPIRSVVSVDPSATTPAARSDTSEPFPRTVTPTSGDPPGQGAGPPPAFRRSVTSRRTSTNSAWSGGPSIDHAVEGSHRHSVTRGRSRETTRTHSPIDGGSHTSSVAPAGTTHASSATLKGSAANTNAPTPPQRSDRPLASARQFTLPGDHASSYSDSEAGTSVRSTMASSKGVVATVDETNSIITARFKHVAGEGGHLIVTGRDGEVLQRCEDEPIHIPGAVQAFGVLIALREVGEGQLQVRIASENASRILGYTPQQLFALDNFADILSEDQADNLLDHLDFIKDADSDPALDGPEVFTLSIRSPGTRRLRKLWCAVHINPANPDLIICEFELEEDPDFPLIPPDSETPEPPEDTLNSNPTAEELAESTIQASKPLRVLRTARKKKPEAAAMEVFNIMSQVQEQLAGAPSLDSFLKVLVGVVKELTGFHRIMIYQFDSLWNGRVVTELVDPRATKDLYKGLHFPASDIPKQARDLYKINRVRLLYDRDQETARLVCRTHEDLERPLDMTHAYLRAMSPIHIKYLANMSVRSSMSISINAFDELWGLISCHSYGQRGTRVSFPIRKMCRLVGDSASRNIERLSYAQRLQKRQLINTVPTEKNPSGYIVASSEDLLTLFDADCGLLSIRDETKILGQLDATQEALALLEYFRLRKPGSVITSQDVRYDFPDLRYQPGFHVIAGLLLVPLSTSGNDFIVFFRKGQLREVRWAGNPYEKYMREGTEGYLEPRKSFKMWSEMVVGKCREWTEDQVETAAVLCLVYGKFIEVWRQKEAALQSSQLTRLLLANSAHEVRTPLNAIINYLEIALEGALDPETRENLSRSHSASKSLIYVINDLLDLTKTEEGKELLTEEAFDLPQTVREATDMFVNDAKRKGLEYEVIEHPGFPQVVVGDQRRVRQAISNIVANAIQNTMQGSVRVEMWLAHTEVNHVAVDIAVQDTGTGMSPKKLDELFRELEQVQTEEEADLSKLDASDASKFNNSPESPGPRQLTEKGDRRTLGLGLALVSRIVRNMNGQLRLKSEEGKGSRFVIQFYFDIPSATDLKQKQLESVQAADSGVGGASGAPQPTTPPVTEGEVMLVQPSSTARGNSVTRARSGSNSSGTAIADGAATTATREPHKRSSRESLKSRNSINSMNSIPSLKSMRSTSSDGRSDVDRLIDAMAEPVGGAVAAAPANSGAASTRSSFHSVSASGVRRHGSVHSGAAPVGIGGLERTQSPASIETAIAGPKVGEFAVTDSKTPVRPVRLPDDLDDVDDSRPGSASLLSNLKSPRSASARVSFGMSDKASLSTAHTAGDATAAAAGNVGAMPSTTTNPAGTASRPLSAAIGSHAGASLVVAAGTSSGAGRGAASAGGPPASSSDSDSLRVLVAEDDMVNSKIIMKRMQKFGHSVQLTVNGEECATCFGERRDAFDVILMDMQMPIVDGLTSTKMIRSLEKTRAVTDISSSASTSSEPPATILKDSDSATQASDGATGAAASGSSSTSDRPSPTTLSSSATVTPTNVNAAAASSPANLSSSDSNTRRSSRQDDSSVPSPRLSALASPSNPSGSPLSSTSPVIRESTAPFDSPPPRRIPIIAVSASLVEKERRRYVDAGFDGWILKPIDFKRLSVLLGGIRDPAVRADCVYRSGHWEHGGWFQPAQPIATAPSATQPRPDDAVGSAGGAPKLIPTEQFLSSQQRQSTSSSFSQQRRSLDLAQQQRPSLSTIHRQTYGQPGVSHVGLGQGSGVEGGQQTRFEASTDAITAEQDRLEHSGKSKS